MESPGPLPHGGARPAAGPGVRLYVFAHAGGSALMFRGWPEHFPAGWRVTALDAPGHGALMGQPLITDGEELVSHFLDRLAPELARPGLPFAFFGHSMGALVAHELTRRLLAAGAGLPVWLGLSACGAPTPGSPPAAGRGRELSDEDLRRRLSLLGGTPARVLEHPALWRVFAPVVRADLRLVESWRTAPAAPPLPVAVSVSVFGGAQDRVTGRQDLARWAQHCERFLGVRLFPGGHFYFQDDPRALAEAVTAEVRLALLARPTRPAGR
jgi:surfactin synthase thioesterase subunit